MDTNDELIKKMEWNNNIKNKEEKEVLAGIVASKVKDGDVISFGSGTTSFLTVLEISKKCEKENLHITAVPTSKQIEKLCEYVHIKTAKLEEVKIDWGFDGADEVDGNNWLIKGLGGALYQEKKNIKKSPKIYILVDASKIVSKLGEKCPVPVECKKEMIEDVVKKLKKIGAQECDIRKNKDNASLYVTDNDNYIIDAKFNEIDKKMEKRINRISGVVDNGLFIKYKNIEIIKNK